MITSVLNQNKTCYIEIKQLYQEELVIFIYFLIIKKMLDNDNSLKKLVCGCQFWTRTLAFNLKIH